MDFSFAQVEKALAHTHSICETKRPAFAARLQHLQKQKFPPGTNTGRGRAARYSVGHLYLLGVVLELNQLGLSPERAIAAVEDDLHAVAMAGALAARNGPPDGKFKYPTLLYLDPAALSGLMQEPNGDRAVNSFFYIGLPDALVKMREWFTGGAQRVSFFSVSALLWDLASYSNQDRKPDHLTEFYQALEAWAHPIIHNVGDDDDRDPQA